MQTDFSPSPPFDEHQGKGSPGARALTGQTRTLSILSFAPDGTSLRIINQTLTLVLPQLKAIVDH
jgi:hypothetical protein